MVIPPVDKVWAVQAPLEKRLQQTDNDQAGALRFSGCRWRAGSVTKLAMGIYALKMKAGSALTSATTAGQGRLSPRDVEGGERCEQ
jgi:hypothetical protein